MASVWRDWVKSIGQNIAATAALALIPGGAEAYLVHIRSVWALPVLAGIGAGLMCVCMWGALQAIAHLPPKRIMRSTETIESCVRTWMDNHRIAIKSDPSSDNYFRFRIMLDSGGKLTVYRSRESHSEYVQIVTDLGIRGDDLKLLDQFTADEKERILMDIKVELARARVGYGGLSNPPENFHIFKRVPIQHNLTEFAFISMVGEVEASMNLVFLVFMKAKYEVDQKIRGIVASTPQLTPSTPTR